MKRPGQNAPAARVLPRRARSLFPRRGRLYAGTVREQQLSATLGRDGKCNKLEVRLFSSIIFDIFLSVPFERQRPPGAYVYRVHRAIFATASSTKRSQREPPRHFLSFKITIIVELGIAISRLT